MDKYLIIAIALFSIGLVFIVINLFKIIASKNDKKVASKMVEEVLNNVEARIKDNIIEHIKNTIINPNCIKEDGAAEFNIIEENILKYSFNEAKNEIENYIDFHVKPKIKDKIYKLVNDSITDDLINTVSLNILETDTVKDLMTDIYNTCLQDTIISIEKEDKELEELLSEYEDEDTKDETIEQHNQSIEEYAKEHIQEKIDEVNEFYDELEKEDQEIINTVPVRDLSELKPLICEELNPPVDDEGDCLIDDGTIEVVKYLDE